MNFSVLPTSDVSVRCELDTAIEEFGPIQKIPAKKASMDGRIERVRGWWLAVLVLAAPVAVAQDFSLMEAVREGDRETVRSLLQEQADVNLSQPDGTTALHWAVHRNDLETTELLIGRGAELDAANDYGVTPLSLACTNTNAALVEQLLRGGANPNVAQWTGETPLMTCSSTGSVEAVRSLLEHGADVNAKENEQDQTALMWAAAEKHPEVVRLLVRHGADIQARSRQIPLPEPFVIETGGVFGTNYPQSVYFPKVTGGFSALLFAVQQGDLESTGILLEAGADVNDYAPEDGSALIVATASGHEELALFLLEQGADPNAKDPFGLTALHYALQEGLMTVAGFQPSPTDAFGWSRPNQPQLVRALLAHGADPNAPILKTFPQLDNPFLARGTEDAPQIEPVGATPFLLAAASSDILSMRILVEGRADIQATTVDGATAFMLAAGLGTEPGHRDEEAAVEAAKLALDLGADVNAVVSNDGRTALHGAALLGWNRMIRFLAERGANLDAEDKYGQTPLTIAMGDPEGRVYRPLPGGNYDDRFRRPREQQETAELLLELGAAPFTGTVRDRSGE